MHAFEVCQKLCELQDLANGLFEIGDYADITSLHAHCMGTAA